ncbi:hypothetical protein Pla144_08650 [Bythopirellula polymerisocia]|uniref:Uncharacterized protein n=1 Tax=Bythopirellula polymerisocia TaxID=2528003 RepID=A0A5C6D5A4_9BACT|nr:hypothetical protein Pla144_08650 [Bythopirellula polymerisocia]
MKRSLANRIYKEIIGLAKATCQNCFGFYRPPLPKPHLGGGVAAKFRGLALCRDFGALL